MNVVGVHALKPLQKVLEHRRELADGRVAAIEEQSHVLHDDQELVVLVQQRLIGFVAFFAAERNVYQ